MLIRHQTSLRLTSLVFCLISGAAFCFRGLADEYRESAPAAFLDSYACRIQVLDRKPTAGAQVRREFTVTSAMVRPNANGIFKDFDGPHVFVDGVDYIEHSYQTDLYVLLSFDSAGIMVELRSVYSPARAGASIITRARYLTQSASHLNFQVVDEGAPSDTRKTIQLSCERDEGRAQGFRSTPSTVPVS